MVENSSIKFQEERIRAFIFSRNTENSAVVVGDDDAAADAEPTAAFAAVDTGMASYRGCN